MPRLTRTRSTAPATASRPPTPPLPTATPITVRYLSSWTDSTKDDERIQWVRDSFQAITPYAEPGGCINCMQDDDYDKIQDNCRKNDDRLVKVKQTYDPGNLFHINQTSSRRASEANLLCCSLHAVGQAFEPVGDGVG